MQLEYRIRIRNAANSADVLEVTSVRGGTNPYITDAPSGDAQKINPRTGESYFGVYSIQLADVDIGSSQRILTSILEDAGQRQQLPYRTAFIEYREEGGSWQVLIAGPITAIRLVSDIKYEVTVSDPMQAHTVKRLFTAADTTLITDFLATWPLRGCLIGGPVKGATSATLNIADLGGWQMRVENATVPGEYFLRPINIYGPPTWRNPEDQESIEELARAINEAAATLQSAPISSAADAFDTIEDTQIHAYSHPGLVVLVDDVPWKPLIFDYESSLDNEGWHVFARLFGYGYQGQRGLKIKTDGVKTLTNGSLVRVRALTILPSELCPIYMIDHPVEILKTLWGAAGIPFSSSACTTLKELIGTDARYGLRITSTRLLSDIVHQVCFPFGIGLRGNSVGEIEPFDARLGRSTTAPLVTIGNSDVEKGSVRAFDLDPSDAITLINFRSKQWIDQRSVPISLRFNDVAGGGPFGGMQTSIVDGIVVSETSLTAINDESGALTFGDIEMAFEGMISGAKGAYSYVRQFFIAIARRVFDRYGRGSQGARMTFLRTGAGAGVQVGDEVLINVSALPNHNYRLGDNGAISARAMQVVQRTVVPKGLDVTLDDSGLSLQPPATLPTISIAASTDMPRTVALGTITNAAALNAASIGIRVQIAYGATATQFFDVIAFAPGQVPTSAIRLPSVFAGTTVYMRARSEVPGSRASNWTASVNVALSGVNAPTAVSATPNAGDGGKCDLEWSTGSGSDGDLVDVFVRLSAESFGEANRIATLEAGSTRYEISGLVTGTDYIASVQHRNAGTQDRSAAVDASFTTVGTAVTLNAPTDPSPFSSAPAINRLLGLNSRINGFYGLGVVASDIPGEIEIWEALEDSPGAGTYGSFTLAGRIGAVSENWTLWQSIAPNDGLRRQLHARSVRDGATNSAYTDTVVATPWTYLALPVFPGNALLELKVTPLSPTAPDRFAYRLTPRDPHPSVAGALDLDLDFDAEAGLVNYEYNSTTPAAAVSAASGDTLDYEAIRPLAGQGAKSVSWRVTKTNRRVGLSGPIVIPELPPGDTSADPQFTDASISSVSSPCDGGGGGDFAFTTANMPGTETYNLSWVVLTGTYAGVGSSASGITSPYSFLAALCPGETIRFVITAIDGGDTIAVGTFEFET